MLVDRPSSFPARGRSLVVALVVGVLGAVSVIAGCGPTSDRSSERVDTVEPVEPVETRRPSTSEPSTTAPPVTKPLTTAPPSALLDEVVAAYDAAYQDLLAASSPPDPDFPGLSDHLAGAELEAVQAALADARAAGLRGSPRPGTAPWMRVEGWIPAENRVDLEVCRFDNTEAVDAAGRVVRSALRPYRYVETIELVNGSWKWTARELIDSGNAASDCALPL